LEPTSPNRIVLYPNNSPLWAQFSRLTSVIIT